MITQNRESSCDLLLSVTKKKASAPGGHSPQEPLFKTLITSLSHNSTRIWVLVWEKCLYFNRIPFNRWLELFNCHIFSRLAFGIKGCSSKTCFISSVFRLLRIALWHYVREHIRGQETKSATAIICLHVTGKFK